MPKATDQVVTEKFVLQVAGKLEQRILEVEQGLGEQIAEVKQEFDQRFTTLDQKLDRVLTQLDSIVGDFRKFDEEQTVLAHRQSIHSDQIEKLEIRVFGAASSS